MKNSVCGATNEEKKEYEAEPSAQRSEQRTPVAPKARALPGHGAEPATSAHGPPRAPGGRSLTPHRSARRVRGRKWGQGGWTRSASVPTAAHNRGSGEPDRTLRRGPARSPLASPVSPPHLVGLSVRSKGRKPNAEDLAHAAPGPRGQVSDDHPPFTPLFPLKNSSRPPTAAPPPPRQNQAPTPPPPQRPAFSDPHWARTQLSAAHSPIRMRICFLPKRREKREEMVRPMAVAALAMGRSKRGLEFPPAFSFYAPGNLSEKESS